MLRRDLDRLGRALVAKAPPGYAKTGKLETRLRRRRSAVERADPDVGTHGARTWRGPGLAAPLDR